MCFYLLIVLLLIAGLFVNGPYACITTAVSNDLVSTEFDLLRRLLSSMIYTIVILVNYNYN